MLRVGDFIAAAYGFELRDCLAPTAGFTYVKVLAKRLNLFVNAAFAGEKATTLATRNVKNRSDHRGRWFHRFSLFLRIARVNAQDRRVLPLAPLGLEPWQCAFLHGILSDCWYRGF
jgi:hypothetical protein